MNNDATIQPSSAIVFYAQKQNRYSIESSVGFATLHEIHKGKMQEGNLTDVETVLSHLEYVIGEQPDLSQELEDCLGERERIGFHHQIIPENVLFESTHRLIWWSPSMVKRMWFKRGSKNVQLTRRVPALMWSVNSETTQLFALANNKRPTNSTPLYRAPFMNCYSQGGICWGDEKPVVNLKNPVETMLSVDRVFFEKSRFSHVNDCGTDHPLLRIKKTPIVTDSQAFAFWKNQSEKSTRFPNSVLVSVDFNVNDLLRKQR